MKRNLHDNTWKSRWRKILNFRNLGLFVFIVILWTLLAFLSPYFFRASNIMVLLLQASTVMICSVGTTFVIISGGIDLSVGAVAALSSMMLGIALTKWGLGTIPAILVGLAAGAAFGALNGILISKYKLQPMVCTLGTMSIARGLTLITTSGRPIYVVDPILNGMGNGRLLGVPVPVILALAVFFIGFIILKFTFFGRNVYSIGGNEEAARLSGINTIRNKVYIYVVSGLCASIVGILMVCTLGASEPTVGQGLELDATAVTAIGGTSLLGGVGSVVGTMFGAILIGTIKNGLTILNIVSYYQQLIIGAVIIFAVLLEYLKRRRR